MNPVEHFEQRVRSSRHGVYDPEGIHHEFSQGLHGRKIDFDNIPTGSRLFNEWVDVGVEHLRLKYAAIINKGRIALLGIANGTNRIVGPLAVRLAEKNMMALSSQKIDGVVLLPNDQKERLIDFNPELVIPFEDVFTTGRNTAWAAKEVLELGVPRVEAVGTWHRSEFVPRLDELGIEYSAIIHHPEQNYEPEQCQAEGYCAAGWALIEY